MKSNRFITKNIITLIIVMTMLFIGLLINWVRIIADDAIIESSIDEMEQKGKQYQIMLEGTLEETSNELRNFADFMAEHYVIGDSIVEFMNQQSQSKEFNNLHYIEFDGSGISLEGEVRDFSEHSSFLQALEHEFSIGTPYISMENSDVVFDLFMPVIKNGETQAVLFCQVSVNEFFETILESKDYEGDFFFLDQELNMIFSTSANHLGLASIPEADFAAMGEDNMKQALSDSLNKKSGAFYYDYYGTDKVMVYYPIEMTNMILAMNVHVESLSSEMIRAAEYFNIAESIIYWTVVLMIVYISFAHSRSHKVISKVAYYDPLTQLPNMAKLKIEMTEVLRKNKKNRYTILVADIENFKAINEIFGYEMGDRVLKGVKTLSDSFQEPSMITARIGSDRFALFAGNDLFTDLSNFVETVSEQYDKNIPELADYGGAFKIGRYHIEIGETDFDDIMAKVNLAYSRAKQTKGQFYCDYDDAFRKTLQAEAEITNKMKQALKNKEFEVFLQPKFDINESKIIGAEALVRWRESTGNMIFPNEFIPLFERNGFIIE